MSTTSTTSSLFTGSSQFATDLQNVITREVEIASLPITLLQDDVTTLQSQSTDLDTLDTQFTALQSAIESIGTAMGGASYQTDISDSSVVSATTSDGVMAGNYTIEVDDIGAYASSMTSSTWVDQDGQAQTYQLVVGNDTYSITPTNNSAASVATAINSQAGNVVSAAVVNVGSTSDPDYRITLQSTTLGPESLDIKLNGQSLQTQQTTGKLAEYIVDNSGQTVTSDSRTVEIAPGLSVTLLAADADNPVNITVASSPSAISSALSTFASAYNTVQATLETERGQSSGALKGQSLVYELTNALTSLAKYSSPGSAVSSLADLGLTLEDDGTLSFSSYTFLATAIKNPSGVNAFLGSVSDGGFLQTATNTIDGIEDTTTGILKTAETHVSDQISSLNDQITEKEDQVSLLQQTLANQMSAADTAIATMEQQYEYIAGLFDAMQVADQQYSA
jgi:flagellar hook-associated protein 2